jgi:hypothetical protein
LTSSSVSQITLPGVRPIAVVEALFDHVHVPAVRSASMIEKPSYDVPGFLRAGHDANLERGGRS